MLHDLIVESGVGLAVATRYTGRRGPLGMDGAWRHPAANLPTLAARVLFPRMVGGKCSDPTTGFFCVDTRSVDVGRLRSDGATILLDILARQDVRVREVPFIADEAASGDHRTRVAGGAQFLRQLVRLRSGRA